MTRGVCKSTQLSIKRKISTINEMKQKVNSSKLINECGLTVSPSMVQRYLRISVFKYKRIPSRIYLNENQEFKRLEYVKSWLSSNYIWEKTIFTDEKRFSLDGPDDWGSYVDKSSKNYHVRRQCGGGGVMIWMMGMPNGLLSFKVIAGNLNSEKYITLLAHNIVAKHFM